MNYKEFTKKFVDSVYKKADRIKLSRFHFEKFIQAVYLQGQIESMRRFIIQTPDNLKAEEIMGDAHLLFKNLIDEFYKIEGYKFSNPSNFAELIEDIEAIKNKNKDQDKIMWHPV